MPDFSPVAAAPVGTRMRWYAAMNSWRVPEDFPVAIATDHGPGQARHPDWNAAWRAVTDNLTEAQASLGWWIYELMRTPEEWRAWWVGNRRLSAEAADDAINHLEAGAAPQAQKPLHDPVNITGVATGSRNGSASESVTLGRLQPSSPCSGDPA